MNDTASPARNFALAASRRSRASSLSGAHDFGVAELVGDRLPDRAVARGRAGQRVGDLVQDGVSDLSGGIVHRVRPAEQDELLLCPAFSELLPCGIEAKFPLIQSVTVHKVAGLGPDCVQPAGAWLAVRSG